MLTDSGGGRVAAEKAKPQPVRWQSTGPAAFRVSWANGGGTLEASEQRGVLAGAARSGTQSWRVSALRESCPRDM
jgi:hypothetical protein